MAINPNTTFVAGDILTAAQQNRLPFGVCASSSSTTNYTLTTTVTIATGMTATFTAIANRLYKITYYEPTVGITSALSGFTNITIRQTNAAGTQLQSGLIQNTAAVASSGTLNLVHVGAFTAGSITVVGCALTSSVTGAPILNRNATQIARLIVEDIGPS